MFALVFLILRPTEDQAGGNERKRPRLDLESEDKEEKDDEEEEDSLAPLKTFDEVKEAFEDFASRVPDEMVPKLYKLLRDHEKSLERDEEGLEEEEEVEESRKGGKAGKAGESLKGDRLISTIIDELRQKLPISALSPGEENVFNKAKGVRFFFFILLSILLD